MAEYKYNHFVPEWLLRNFESEDKKFYCYDKTKPQKGVHHRNTGNVFGEDNLYVLVENNGIRDVSLEKDHFSPLDNDAKVVVQKILSQVRHGKPPQLSPVELNTWHKFRYHQVKRTPDSHAKLQQVQFPKEHIKKIVEKIEENCRPLTNQEWDRVSSDETTESILKGALHKAMMTETPEILRVFESRGMIIGKPRNDRKSFVIGSNPLVLLAGIFESGTTDWWFPVAHDVAICVGGPPGSEAIRTLDDNTVRKINETSFKQSGLVGSRSKQLLDSLISSR